MSSILLEICIASVEDALAARDGGADRVELNSGLALGGLTPSLGMIHDVRQAVELPLVVMIRPRAGGFRYSQREFAVMRRDVDLALEHGADGIAFGILHADGALDINRCRQLVDQAEGRETVFHRAFDCVPDPSAPAQLASLGIRRVMTSGGCETALAGAARIAELVGLAASKIEILPAGKINAASAAEIVRKTSCQQVHAAVRTELVDATAPGVSYEATSPKEVLALRRALDLP